MLMYPAGCGQGYSETSQSKGPFDCSINASTSVPFLLEVCGRLSLLLTGQHSYQPQIGYTIYLPCHTRLVRPRTAGCRSTREE
jgi:hypothetical protein